MVELGTRSSDRKRGRRKLSTYGCMRRVSTRRRGRGVRTTDGGWPGRDGGEGGGCPPVASVRVKSTCQAISSADAGLFPPNAGRFLST